MRPAVKSTAVWSNVVLALLLAGGCARQITTNVSIPAHTSMTFGNLGSQPGSFVSPRAIAIGASGTVFVVDKSGRVQRFGPDGRFEHQWALPECDKGYPSGIHVDSAGRVFVADTHNHRVVVYDGDGRELRRLGTDAVGPGRLTLVTDVAVGLDGAVYVAEFGGVDRIVKFDREGQYLFSFGDSTSGAGALQRPSGLACDADGSIWVADTSNHRICHFDRDGRFLTSFGELGRQPGQLRYPRDLALCADGLIVVVDMENDRVQSFDRDGGFVAAWGHSGRSDGQLDAPLNVAVHGTRLYVTDSANNRIVVVDGQAVGLLPVAQLASRERGAHGS